MKLGDEEEHGCHVFDSPMLGWKSMKQFISIITERDIYHSGKTKKCTSQSSMNFDLRTYHESVYQEGK